MLIYNFFLGEYCHFFQMIKPKAIICEEVLIDIVKESLAKVNLNETTIYIFGASNTKAKSVNELIADFELNSSSFK